MRRVFPAKAEVGLYGEFPRPVGVTGRTCQKLCSDSERSSANL